MTRKPLYFLSDVHLGTGTREAERQKRLIVLDLLKEVREQASSLYIVGDLFDFWFEYRHVLPRGHHAVITALEDLVQNGISVTYLAGNHDFAIGEFFSREIGAFVVPDDLTFTWDDRVFYVFHGDGLAVHDGGYRLLKRVLRSRIARWGFRWLHPDIGFALAHATSHTSRDYTSGKFYGAEDGMMLEAERRIRNGADFVVMGHRHAPVRREIGTGVYVNLGDWLTHNTYAVYADGQMHMYAWTPTGPKRIIQ